MTVPAPAARLGSAPANWFMRKTARVASQDDEQVQRDRQALGAISGRSFDGMQWPTDAMPPGTRVRVVKDQAWDGPWRVEFTATIDATIVPNPVQGAAARPGELEYSVTFDSPQQDVDGDGPYRKAVIWGRYLEQI